MKLAVTSVLSWPYIRRGHPRCFHDLSVELARRGHEVHLVTAAPGPKPRTRAALGITIHYLPLREWVALTALGVQKISTFAPPCTRWLREHEFDLVFATHPIDAFAAARACAATGTPWVHMIGDCNPFWPEIRFGRRMFEWAVARPDAHVTVSTFVADKLRHDYGVEAKVIPTPFGIEEFPAGDPKRSDGDAAILCTAALTHPRKRVELLVRAFPHVLAAEPGARLVLAAQTTPETTERMLSLVPEDARSHIEVPGLGRRQDLPGRYRDATITVLPSRNESFGLVLVESLASGTYAVASRSGGMPDILDDPAVGALFGADATPEEVAATILEALPRARDPGTPARCRRHVEERYTFAVVGEAYERLFEEVLAARGRSPTATSGGPAGSGRDEARRAEPGAPRDAPDDPLAEPDGSRDADSDPLAEPGEPGATAGGRATRPPAPAGRRALARLFLDALDAEPFIDEDWFALDVRRPEAVAVATEVARREPPARRILVLGDEPRAAAILLRACGHLVRTGPAPGVDGGGTADALPAASGARREPADVLVLLDRDGAPTGAGGFPLPRAGGLLLRLHDADHAAGVPGAAELSDARVVSRRAVQRGWGSVPARTWLRRVPRAVLERALPPLRSRRLLVARVG